MQLRQRVKFPQKKKKRIHIKLKQWVIWLCKRSKLVQKFTIKTLLVNKYGWHILKPITRWWDNQVYASNLHFLRSTSTQQSSTLILTEKSHKWYSEVSLSSLWISIYFSNYQVTKAKKSRYEDFSWISAIWWEPNKHNKIEISFKARNS